MCVCVCVCARVCVPMGKEINMLATEIFAEETVCKEPGDKYFSDGMKTFTTLIFAVETLCGEPGDKYLRRRFLPTKLYVRNRVINILARGWK